MSDKEIIRELEIEVEELEFTISNSTKKLKKVKEILRNLKTLEYPKSFKTVSYLKIWLDENGIEHQGVYSHGNGDWSYLDKQGIEHLIRNGVELTKNVKAIYVSSYISGNWGYMDEQCKWHYFDKDNNKIN